MEKKEYEARPLTYEEAVDIAEDFEDLVGTDFGIPSLKDAEVGYVCIAPYDKDNQQVFLSNLKLSADTEAALKFYLDAGHKDFDVLIIGTGTDEEIVYAIRAYAGQLGLNYRFP